MWLAALGALTLVRFVIAAATPLSPDEAYYWVWSRALAPGFLDHPPMVAFWIAGGTALAGDTTFGIRLLGPVAAALGSLALWRAGRRLYPGTDAGVIAAALMNATLFSAVGAVTMTPDTPLLFFWTLALAALAEVATRPVDAAGPFLLAAGLALGLALDSKYTAFLLVGGAGLWLLLTPSRRVLLRDPAAWASACLALAVFAPVLWWNATHDWASFAKQGGRVADFAPSRALRFLGELVLSQVGLLTPIVAAFAVAGTVVATRAVWRTRAAGPMLLACLILPGALVFVQHATGDRVQANWPSVLAPASLLAGAALGGRWVRWRGAALGLGFALTALVYVQATLAPVALPVTRDPSMLRLAGWPGFAREVEAARVATGAHYVAADNYGIAAELARRLPPGVMVVGVEPRWRSFDLPAAPIDGVTGLFVRSDRRGDDIDRAPWATLDPAGTAARTRDGLTAEGFRLYRVVGRPSPTPAVLLPRPR